MGPNKDLRCPRKSLVFLCRDLAQSAGREPLDHCSSPSIKWCCSGCRVTAGGAFQYDPVTLCRDPAIPAVGGRLHHTRTTGEALEGLTLLQWRVQPSRGFPCFRTVTNMVNRSPWIDHGAVEDCSRSSTAALVVDATGINRRETEESPVVVTGRNNRQQEFRRPSKLHRSIHRNSTTACSLRKLIPTAGRAAIEAAKGVDEWVSTDGVRASLTTTAG